MRRIGRSFVSSLWVSGVVALGLPVYGCSGAGESPATEEGTASVDESIVNGSAVSAATMDAMGLVYINGTSCSGVLLDSSWVLTAQHCYQNIGVTAQSPTALTVTLASKGASSPATSSDHIYAFGQHDVVLVHLKSAIAINGSYSYKNTLSTLPVEALAGKTLACYGQGYTASAPTANIGVWTTANLTVSDASGDSYSLSPNALKQIQWPGDSGGPCFYNGQLTGIQSGVSYSCTSMPAGAKCGIAAGQYAVGLSTSQVSANFLSGWIASIRGGLAPIPSYFASGFDVIQSRYGTKGNFELVGVLPSLFGGGSSGIQHYYRNNDAPYGWHSAGTFGTSLPVVTGVTLIESSYGNLELMATSGSSVYGFWKAPNGAWSAPYLIPGATHERGTPGFVQSNFGTPGNFELAVGNSTAGIDYFWRNNSAAGAPWAFAGTIATSLGKVDDVVLFESRQSTMEVAARVGTNVYQLTRGTNGVWSAPLLVATRATGRPAFFQSSFGTNGNYELVVPSSNGGFEQYARSNDPTTNAGPWSPPTPALGGRGTTYHTARVFQGNYGAPGNFELFGGAGVAIEESWREFVQFPTTFTGSPSADTRYIGPLPLANNP